MFETTTPTDYEIVQVNERNLFAKLWFNPTATLRFILAYCPDKHVMSLLVLGGIARAIDRATTQHQGDKMSTIAILLLALVGGGLFGWLTYFVYAWGMSVAGRWLGGQADTDTFKIVIAWSLVPTIAALLLIVPQVVVFGDEMFKRDLVVHSLASRTLVIACYLAECALAIWSFIIMLKGILLIQGFQLGRALANMLLPGGILVGFILFLVLVFKAFEYTIG